MLLKNISFIKSAAKEGDFLDTDKPLIAVCGKSNVGKSSFINMLANMNKLAKTSDTPGRTRLVNYFDFDKFVLADLPGYGFARVSKEEKNKWAVTLQSFFDRGGLKHVFVLLDIRHKPTAEDIDMINYLYHYAFPFSVIATKADKLGKSRVKPAVRELAAAVRMGEDNVIAVSSVKKSGREETLAKIESILFPAETL